MVKYVQDTQDNNPPFKILKRRFKIIKRLFKILKTPFKILTIYLGGSRYSR
jgi:hypothetical protein